MIYLTVYVYVFLDLFFLCLFLLKLYLWFIFLPLFLPSSILLFLHFCVSFLSFVSFRINEAANFKDHKIQVASCLISLKVEPSPALSINLSGAPLIKIVLTHVLVRINKHNVPVSSLFDSYPYLPFTFSVSQSYWENKVLFQLPGTVVGCGAPTLSEERGPWFVCGSSSRISPIWNLSALFLAFLLCEKMRVYHWPRLVQLVTHQRIERSLFWFSLACLNFSSWSMWLPESKLIMDIWSAG